MTANVVLILGAGPRVGAAVADKFASDGYKVVIASRKGTGSETDKGFLSLKADFADPTSIPALFETVKAQLHTVPNVVIYNAAALTPPPDPDSVLSAPATSVAADLNINTISPYVAAQQAISAWETLPREVEKTFIYTGNIANVTIIPVPLFLTLDVGKSASAYWVGLADTTYSAKGYRFFYADERAEDGGSAGQALDGPAHGDFFAQLARHEGAVPWHATFVKGKGYVHFKLK